MRNVASDSVNIKKVLRTCFNAKESENAPPLPQVVQDMMRSQKKVVEAQLKAFIDEYSHLVNSGLSIAKIFHGISSPKHPFEDWMRSGFWRKFAKFDFNSLVEMASKELTNVMTE